MRIRAGSSLIAGVLLLTGALHGCGGATAARSDGALDPQQGRERDAARAELIRHWEQAPNDSATLDRLERATIAAGGADLMRAVQGIVADRARAPEVRIAGMRILTMYVSPKAVFDPVRRGRPDMFGDTLSYNSCGAPWIDHPDYELSSSIEPALRETFRRWLAQLDTVGDPLSWELDCLALFTHRFDVSVDSIAAGWQPDSVSLGALSNGQRLRDRRIVALLDRIAADDDYDLSVRWSALQALATHVHPALDHTGAGRALDTRTGRRTLFGEGDWCTPWGWHHHHAVQEEGEQPLGASGRQEVLRMLRRHARRNPDDALRAGAADLAACAERFLAESPIDS